MKKSLTGFSSGFTKYINKLLSSKKKRGGFVDNILCTYITSRQMQSGSIKTQFLAFQGTQIMLLISKKSTTSHLGRGRQTK